MTDKLEKCSCGGQPETWENIATGDEAIECGKCYASTPYFTKGYWVDGWERQWALDRAREMFPGESVGVAYMGGPVMCGFVPHETV